MCTESGGLVSYAVTADSEEELSEKMSSKFQKMSQYLTQNQLCINTDKTHIMIMCTEQWRRHIDTEAIIQNTGVEVISRTLVEFFLYVQVPQDLAFDANFLCSRSSVSTRC